MLFLVGVNWKEHVSLFDINLDIQIKPLSLQIRGSMLVIILRG